MKTFTILSKFKFDAFESNCTEFLAEDLVSMINHNDVMVIVDPEYLNEVEAENPQHKYKYTINIERN